MVYFGSTRINSIDYQKNVVFAPRHSGDNQKVNQSQKAKVKGQKWKLKAWKLGRPEADRGQRAKLVGERVSFKFSVMSFEFERMGEHDW